MTKYIFSTKSGIPKILYVMHTSMQDRWIDMIQKPGHFSSTFAPFNLVSGDHLIETGLLHAVVVQIYCKPPEDE